MMKWNNLTQMERKALYVFGVPDKKETISHLYSVSDLAVKVESKRILRRLAAKLEPDSVTDREYRSTFCTVKNHKEQVLIRTTAVYQEKSGDLEANRPWTAMGKVMLISSFGDMSIHTTIDQLAVIREYVVDEALRAVIKKIVDDLRDMDYLTSDLFPAYLNTCQDFDLEHYFKADEEILSHYKDGGYSVRFA